MSVEKPETAAELAEQIESITTGASGYEGSADALWKVAQAAFDYTARKHGVTGFQASWAALKFYTEEMRVKGPFLFVKVEDALYPQYDIPARVAEFLEQSKPWMAEQAKAKLAENLDHVSPRVIEHWRELAEG